MPDSPTEPTIQRNWRRELLAMLFAFAASVVMSWLWSTAGWPARSTAGLATFLLAMTTVRLWPQIRAGERAFVGAAFAGVAVLTVAGHFAFAFLE